MKYAQIEVQLPGGEKRRWLTSEEGTHMEVTPETVAEATKVAEEIVKKDEVKSNVVKLRKPRAKKEKVKTARAKEAKGEKPSKRETEAVKQERKRDRKAKQAKRSKQPRKRQHGPAYEEMKNKLRKDAVPGECRFKGCKTKPASKRARTCTTHKKEYRKLQLALNNVTWRKRIEQGKALHHVIYNRHVTKWALQNPVAARRIVKEGGSIVDLETFEAALAKDQTRAKLEADKAKAREQKAKKSKAA